MKIDSCPPQRITTLPADVTLDVKRVQNPIARWRRKGDTSGCKLQVVEYSVSQVVVQLHEDLADHGPGIYEIVLYDSCDECGRVPIELEVECDITAVTVKQAKDETSQACH